MALATQCPHCHTTFRVAHDQLKLRAGLVRCGACKQIFNGIENLLRSEEPELPAKPAPQPASKTELHTEPSASDQEALASPETTSTPAIPEPEIRIDETAYSVTPEASPPPDAIAPTETKEDPLLRMTLMDIAAEKSEQNDTSTPTASATIAEKDDALEQTLDDLQSKPWRKKPDTPEDTEGDALDQAEASDYEEPAFVRQGRRRQRIGRALRIFMAAGSVILLVGLLAQSAYVFRDQIAARFPQARPALVEACGYIDCQVGLPAHADSVSIESSELQTLSANDNTFVLTVLLRNQGTTAQAWPHIELTLNDANEKPIVRRVFAPRDYLLPAQDFSQGFAPNSEQPAKLFFKLSQLKASGYRVYLFYP
ncbi:MAG TPA: DUF3426 domain-containing protein [Noviherbaspirillum sp.]|nr:DUF3426 domain-containing protein [Noviherbaspirillum sp.]